MRDPRELENEYLRDALRRAKAALTVPAAEYVPAIRDAWKIIDEGLGLAFWTRRAEVASCEGHSTEQPLNASRAPGTDSK